MYLYIIDVFEFNIVLYSYGKRITCQMAEICRVAEQAADAACCKHGKIGFDDFCISGCIADNRAKACAFMLDDIEKRCIFNYRDIRKLFDCGKELTRDFLSGDVFVEQNAVI